MKSLILSSADIAKIVQQVGLDRLMDDTIAAIRQACLEYDPQVNQVPARAGFAYRDANPGLIEWMPAMKLNDKVSVKIVGYHPHNPATFKLPTILSTLLAFDTANGHLLSVVDGTFLTSLRTGAASAVASQILAAPDSTVVGCIGAGAQSITQLHALSRLFTIERVLVYDVEPDASDSFRSRLAMVNLDALDIQVLPLEAVAKGAEILCTTTSIDIGQGPLFDGIELNESVHINAVGSDFPGKVELPHSLLKNALVCPDFEQQALLEGECQQLNPQDLGPDLVTLIKQSDLYHAYRVKRTVFDSTGWALEDYVVSEVITGLAHEFNCGSEIDIESVCDDPRNPYGFLSEIQLPGQKTSSIVSASDWKSRKKITS